MLQLAYGSGTSAKLALARHKKSLAAKDSRIAALDILRGLTIALMLLVNNVPPGVKVPSEFRHAAWGEMIHLADLVFPWLLYCVGVAIPLSRAAFLRRRLRAWRYRAKVAGRAVALFALGCVLESSISHQVVISLGVLQLIALAYLFAAGMGGWTRANRLLVAFALLVAYWAALRFLPIPGEQVAVVSEKDNVVYFLNQTLFGPYNLWGLPSVIPTTALVLLGTLAGDWIRFPGASDLQKVACLLIAGGFLVGLGFYWDHSVPFSKALWSPAYILLTAGLASGLLGLLYTLADWLGWRWLFYPFLVFGSNAILAYVAPVLLKVLVLHQPYVHVGGAQATVEHWGIEQLAGQFGSPMGEWMYTGLFIFGWWLVLWVLYQKHWFVRV